MNTMLEQLINKLNNDASTVEFKEVMAVISEHYNYHATQFTNGLSATQVINDAGSNEGSCKIFAFAQMNQLSEQQTLACFGDYYRVDVLQNPDNVDHQNIRNFMKDGWRGVQFDGVALTLKGE